MQPAIHDPRTASTPSERLFANMRRAARDRMARAAELFTTFSAPIPPAPPATLPPIPTSEIQRAHELIEGGCGLVGEVERIQRAVLAYFPDVSMKDMKSPRRFKLIVRARQIAMYITKEETERSLPDIGRRFGGRDHTTVLYAHRKIKRLIETDTELAEMVNKIRAGLAEAAR